MDFSNLFSAATSAAGSAPFQDVAKLFEAFNMDRLQEAQLAGEADDVEERRDEPLPFPQLPSVQPLAPEPPDASVRRVSTAASGSAFSHAYAHGVRAAGGAPLVSAAPPDASVSAARAAEEAFLADMTSAGLDLNVSVVPDDEPPSSSLLSRAPHSSQFAPTPGGVGRRSALRAAPGAGTFAVAHDSAVDDLGGGGVLESARVGAATLFDDAIKRAAVAAAGVRSSASIAAVGFSSFLTTSVGGGAAPAPSALPSVASAATGSDWLSRYMAPSARQATANAPPTPGGVRRGPASMADRAIFSMLGVGGSGSSAGASTTTRDGVPIVTLDSRGGASKGLNPALLGSSVGTGAGASSLTASCEAMVAPVLAPLCCALVPVSLLVRAGALCCAGVLSCAGLTRCSSGCRVIAERATPRAIVLALILFAIAYIVWHWGVLGSDGALEWGSQTGTKKLR